MDASPLNKVADHTLQSVLLLSDIHTSVRMKHFSNCRIDYFAINAIQYFEMLNSLFANDGNISELHSRGHEEETKFRVQNLLFSICCLQM
jgi:hypothetical protein